MGLFLLSVLAQSEVFLFQFYLSFVLVLLTMVEYYPHAILPLSNPSGALSFPALHLRPFDFDGGDF